MADWELSKENIRPLVKGRDMKLLSEALSHGISKEWQDKKEHYECQLKTYDGDDPLQIWYEYILWLEQNTPKIGENDLRQLIYKCVQKFTAGDSYNNDKRFFEVCLRYADISHSPLEAISYFYSKQMFHLIPEFYIRWAEKLELVRNYKKADYIYRDGLSVTHKDKLLEQHYKSFQARFMKHIASKKDSSDDDEEDFQGRNALNELPTLGKKKKAPCIRKPLGIHNPIPQISAVPPERKKGSIFVYKDNTSTLELPAKDNKLHPFEDSPKENIKKPSKWSNKDSRLKKKSTFLSGEVAKDLAHKFTVYSDNDDGASQCTTTEVMAATILQDHKDDYFSLVTDTLSNNVKYMCNLNKLYDGTEEWSIEEIRAIRYQDKDFSTFTNKSCIEGLM